jgi:hypothetical protein
VLALAPICINGHVITKTGGTLGLTGAYGVNDSTFSRRRVEADLAVFREYLVNYRGMKEACKQQLDWGVERYAKLPQPPELLALQYVPSFRELLFGSCSYWVSFWQLLFGIPVVLIGLIPAAFLTMLLLMFILPFTTLGGLGLSQTEFRSILSDKSTLYFSSLLIDCLGFFVEDGL